MKLNAPLKAVRGYHSPNESAILDADGHYLFAAEHEFAKELVEAVNRGTKDALVAHQVASG